MKHLLLTVLLLRSFWLIQAQDVIIKNVNIISMTTDQKVKRKSVLIKSGKIEKIGSLRSIKRSAAKIIDAEGQYLMPGLADMHVHLPGNENEEINHLLESSVAAGVTHIRVMNNKYSQVALKNDLANDKSRIAPIMHYSHLIKRSLKKASAMQMDSILTSVKKQGLDFIKLYSIASEDLYDKLMASAKKQGMIVCGHYPRYVKDKRWNFVEIEKVLQSELRSIEHLGGYTSIKNESRLINAIELTKEKGVYNCPTLDWAIMKYHVQYPNEVKNRLTNKSLSKKITGDWPEAYTRQIDEAGGEQHALEVRQNRLPVYEKKVKVLKLLYEYECPLLVGSDADGPYQAVGYNIWEEMKDWSNVGIDNYTILKSATRNAAAFFKEEANWGTVEEGKFADLILLDKNPLENIDNISTIRTTIIRGRLINPKELLR